MKYLFAFMLLMHGLIHLMGFAKAFKYSDITQLTQPISKTAGLFWLLSALLFIVAVTLFLLKKDSWWMVAAPAVVISQVLIFISWSDAKFGTIANIIALVAIALAYGAWNFNGMVQREQETLLSNSSTIPEIVTQDRLAGLPPVVQKWLARSGVVGKEIIRTVHLKQTGEMKTKPGGKWIPFTAGQVFTVDKPGFIWHTKINLAPGITMTGRDKYENGRGNMLIKLMSIFTVADAKGPETDQGTMLRYLAETIWFPSAALSEYIQWEQTDSLSAKATMTYGSITASGIFRFNAAGDMTGFEAKRYYDRKEGATLEDWFIRSDAWKEMDGIRVPYKSEVTWKLTGGDFTWLTLEVTELAFNATK